MADETYIFKRTTFGQNSQGQDQDSPSPSKEVNCETENSINSAKSQQHNYNEEIDPVNLSGATTTSREVIQINRKSDKDKTMQEICPLTSTNSSDGQFLYPHPQSLQHATGQPSLTPFTMDNGQLSFIQPQLMQPTIVCMPTNAPNAKLVTLADDFQYLSACACCCCWLIGLCAIYSTRKAIDANYRGDVMSAKKYGSRAKWISIIAIVFGIITYIAVQSTVAVLRSESSIRRVH